MEGGIIDLILTTLSWICLGIGGAFAAIGAIGILRLPDIFTRMHAAGITDTVGATFILLGMALDHGFTLVSVKLGLIFIFIMLTSPTASHALARAALYGGEKPLTAEDLERDAGGKDKEAASS
ncbi:monovalent cation/H(+) antiporter subunit G [Magnetospira sp. QH-2]|uniref:monovalent cation/H(+) antiporter subunit G n=1 Tax=Magnetospira sp. (strain QH-2) TaxID=1288970 RepID=UPI0003E80ACA|nr:monovalent cation/H(+) antiporter subunit G [Magnetospira sp. QH-2]CCQ73462.1 conserved membrane protein of unknown function [Magnetospira sp. QH-2]